MSSDIEYECAICNITKPKKSHIDKHLKTNKHQDNSKTKELELEKLSKSELRKEYGTSKIDKIIKNLSCVKKEHIELPSESDNEIDTEEMPKIEQSYSNKDTLRDMVHNIHNFLRNKGAGYGMNALKIFNLFYGLKKIEKNGHFEKTGLPDYCKFSNIKAKFDENVNTGFHFLNETVLQEIFHNNNMYYMLYTPIPDGMKPNIINQLLDMIEKLVSIEETNFQLTGKIYEYFIGRDATAISELGAYFTDRHIIKYIFKDLLKPTLDEDNNIKTMIDMFGGSGGFTLGYMNYLKENYNINWKNNLNKVYHYDMNLDVVKYAKLEYYCITGEFPENNIGTRNAFQDEFKEGNMNKKYHYICTNPPYGGDKIERTEQVEINQLIKKEIEQYFKDKYKVKNMKQVSKLELSSIEKNKNKQYEKICKELKDIDDNFRSKTVMLSNSSDRFQNYAKDNKIDGSKCKDKEAVSFLMMMDMLEEGGTAIGVLKEGLFFDSKYKHLREHLINNFNVTKVVSIDASQFENTTTKTSIIMFSNTGKTEKINFYDLIIEKEDKTTLEEKEDGTYQMKTFKDRIVNVYDKHLATATYNQLVENEYTLNHKKYNKIVLVPNDGYEMVRLGDVCEFLPKSKRLANFANEDGKFRYYSSGSKILKCISADYKEKDIIIIGHSGDGCIFYDNTFSTLLTNHLLFNENKLKLKYIYYTLKSLWDKFYYSSYDGSTVKNTSDKNISIFHIPIPKTEQKMKYWVDKINKPYNRLLECKEKLKSLEEQVQTDIQALLDNNDTEDIALGELCEFKSGAKFNMNPYIVKESEFGILRTRNLDSQSNDFLFINKEGFDKVKNCILKVNDLIVSAFTDSFCCEIINKKYNNFTFNGGLFRLNNIKINIKYLYYYIKSNKFLNIIKANGVSSTASQINIKTLKQIKITLPKDRKLLDSLNPLFEEIDNLNEEIPKQEELYNKYIEELKKDAIKDTSNKDTSNETFINTSIDNKPIKKVKSKKVSKQKNITV
jgi:restriction endonuclease S subunit